VFSRKGMRNLFKLFFIIRFSAVSFRWSAASCAIYLPSIFITVAEFFCFLVFPTDTNGGKHICFIVSLLFFPFSVLYARR